MQIGLNSDADGNPPKAGNFYWVWLDIDPDYAEECDVSLSVPVPAQFVGGAQWRIIGSAVEWPARRIGERIAYRRVQK